MPFIPSSILTMWLRGLMSVAIIAGGIFFLRQWYEQRQARETTRLPSVEGEPDTPRQPGQEDDRAPAGPREAGFGWGLGPNRETAELAAGLILLAVAFAGQAGTRGLYHL